MKTTIIIAVLAGLEFTLFTVVPTIRAWKRKNGKNTS